VEAEHDEQRKSLGVSDDLKSIDGLTTRCWSNSGKTGQVHRGSRGLRDRRSHRLDGARRGRREEYAGYLGEFDVSREQADAMIMAARVRAGWVEEPARRPSPKRMTPRPAPTPNRPGEASMRKGEAKTTADRSAPAWSPARRGRPRRCCLRPVRRRRRRADVRRKLPGRGVWTRLDFATVRQAAAKQAFSRGFRVKVNAAPDLAEEVDRLLERDALQSSRSSTRRARGGGRAKVEAAIHAARSSGWSTRRRGADGASKLERLLRGRFGEAADAVRR